jgi:hypothetical protein
MEYAHGQRIANPEWVSVGEYELSGSERLRIAKLEQWPADRWRREKREVMLRMVCDCLGFAPLSAGIDLKWRTAPDAVRIGHDETGSSPDDSSAAAAIATADFDDRLSQQLGQPVEV